MSLAESVGDDSSFKEGKKINSTLQWLRPLIAAPQPRAKVVAKASPLQFCCPPLSLGRNFRGKRLVIECKKKKKKPLMLEFVKMDAQHFPSAREKPDKEKSNPGDALRVPPDAPSVRLLRVTQLA